MDENSCSMGENGKIVYSNLPTLSLGKQGDGKGRRFSGSNSWSWGCINNSNQYTIIQNTMGKKSSN